MKFVKILGNILLFIALLSFSKSSYPQSSDTVYIYANTIKENTIVLDNVWRYHPGDDPLWASPNFNAMDWDTVRTSMYFEDFPQNEWKGTGWFRKVIAIDSAIYNKTVALGIYHFGASEIYVNGKLQCSFGKISSNPDEIELYQPYSNPAPLELDSNKYYTLAVRYSLPESTLESFWYSKITSGFGFIISIDDLGRSIKALEEDNYLYVGLIGPFVGLIGPSSLHVGIIGPLLSLSLLFFLLFFFSSKKKEYLYYSLYLFLIVMATLSSWHYWTIRTDFIYKYFYNLIYRSAVILAIDVLLACFYTIFYQKLIKPFWYFLAVSILIIIYTAVYLNEASYYLLLGFIILAGIENIRIIVIALKRKIRNAWVIGTGFIVLFVVFTLFTLMGRGIVKQWNYDLLTYVAVFSFPVSILVYLVRSYSEININLKKQLVTVRELTDKEIENEKRTAALTVEAEKDKSAKKEAELRAQIAEAENERKTKEFEQARQLQLSMLPKEIPSLPNLDIAVYMKTATEVGGDYYDFYKSDENVLNIVVGDATGHGLNAGMMVSISKGLFQNLVTQPDLSNAVSKFNYSLISMKLSPMLMSLFFLRIYDNQLQVTGAGMPPLLVYQSKANCTIEVESSGPPLGAFLSLTYEINNYGLSTGDVIVLMSDGFAERMNEKKEFFGWNKGRELLANMVDLTADKIINEFVKVSDEWGGDREQDDDITFVVIKVK